MTVTPDFLYSLFSDLYYKEELPQYTNKEVSTTESVQCLLKSFYQRKLAYKLLEPKIVILSFGKLVHFALQEQLTKRGYQTEVETSYQISDVTLYTHTDAVHETHTLEIKTISRMPHEILSHHFLQSNTYVTVNKKPYGYVAYIHKPSGICKTFKHTPNEEAFKYIILRTLSLSKYLQTNTTPPPEPDWLCQYCEYTKICSNPKQYVSRKGGL